MKFETRKQDKFSSVLFSFTVPFTNRVFRIQTQLYQNPEEWVYGYSSRTKNGRYVLFHDYDDVELKDIVEELKWLQKEYKLSDYYIFKMPDAENSFHAVCLDTHPLSQAYEIQKQTSCDMAFIHAIKYLKSKEWILRLSKKGKREAPRYLMTVCSRHGRRVKSTAHANLLRSLGIQVNGAGKWDKETFLGVVKYNTANRVK